MKFRDKQAAKRSIRLSARQSGISYADCRREMAAAIDAAWATTDPEAQAYQEQLFPGGKPSVEEFIAVLGHRVNDEQHR